MSASLLVWRNKMKKTFQKWISALLCAALVAAGSVCAFADTENAKDTAALADGSYTVGAATDTTGAGRMFHIAQQDNNTCKLEVQDGKMTAIVRLNGQGYDKLYLGTAADALKAAGSAYLPYEKDAEGMYTFRIPVESFDTVMKLAAYGTKGKAWHDHNIVFYKDVPAAPKAEFEAVSGTVTVKWNKSAEAGIYGYEAEYATCEDFSDKETVTIQGASKTSQKLYLESGNTYYLRVRSIKSVNDSKVYSVWSDSVVCKTGKLSKTKLTSVAAGKKSAAIKWTKKSGISGYEVQYSTSSKFAASKTKTLQVSKSAVSKKVTGLKSGKKYYFRIRTYKTVTNGKRCANWSAVKSVKVK